MLLLESQYCRATCSESWLLRHLQPWWLGTLGVVLLLEGHCFPGSSRLPSGICFAGTDIEQFLFWKSKAGFDFVRFCTGNKQNFFLEMKLTSVMKVFQIQDGVYSKNERWRNNNLTPDEPMLLIPGQTELYYWYTHTHKSITQSIIRCHRKMM